MAWNEPGGSRDNDPWSGGNRGRKNNGSGPPDLDEYLRKLRQSLGGLFGGKSGGGGGGGAPAPLGKIVMVVALVALGIWAATGIYTVDEGKQAVILRFGKDVGSAGPGPHWHIPYPIERVEIINVKQVRSIENSASMLTQDENIVTIKIGVQYVIKNARDYLFNVQDPEQTLSLVTESSIRAVVGRNKIDFVLKEGKNEIGTQLRQMVQKIMDDYKSGVQISEVNLPDAQPPEAVQNSFLDVQRAREDEPRLRNEAEAYANDIIPKARGAAARLMEEANAYKSQVVAQARGEAQRFTQVLAQYEKAPKVMRDRLYIDTLESVLSRSSKVLVDTKAGNNMLYLPLDKMTQRPTAAASGNSGLGATSASSPMVEESRSPSPMGLREEITRPRDDARSREQR